MNEADPMTLQDEIGAILNRFSRESVSNTPEFILARYLERCLTSFDLAVQEREAWHGRVTK